MNRALVGRLRWWLWGARGGAAAAAHPSDEQLAAYIDAGLPPAERAAVSGHLADCDRCSELVADTLDELAGEIGAGE